MRDDPVPTSIHVISHHTWHCMGFLQNPISCDCPLMDELIPVYCVLGIYIYGIHEHLFQKHFGE